MDCCIIPGCAGERPLFRVPNAGSNVFRRWKKVAPVYGTGTERICSHHFTKHDFQKNIRKKLKTSATPSIQLPAVSMKAATKSGCCIIGCRSKDLRKMERFPSSTSPAWKKWVELLGCKDTSTIGWRICRNHFKDDAFTTVTSIYLKSNSVPTKKLSRPVKTVAVHRRRVIETPIPECLIDHNYSTENLQPKSNRMCSVFGCTAKTSKGVFLHKFPKEISMLKVWMHAIKTGKTPTKNSYVCSQHFHDSDYSTGTNVLRKCAVPSRNIPQTFLQEVQSRTSDPYKRIFKSFRKTKKDVEHHSDGSHNPQESSSLETSKLLNSVVESGPSGLCAVDKSTFEFITETSLNRNTEAGPSEVCTEEISTNSENQTNPLNCFEKDHIHQDENTEAMMDSNVLEKTIQTHGIAILSDFLITEKHITTWTGIPSLKLLEVLCAMVKTMEDNVYPKKYKMHATDRVILTLVKLKQNLSFAALSTVFSISPTTVAEYFSYTVQVLAEVLGTMVYMPSQQEIKKNIPHCFKGKFEKVRCILDCTEMSIASPNCLNCRIACYSNYKHKRTVKFLLGVTPAGLISFCSRGYSGKSSDKYIFIKENFIDKLEKHHDEIMVDKGFAIEKECAENGIRLHIPPFLREDRLRAEDAILNESIAKARVHVERAIERVKRFGVLRGSVDASVLRHIDDIMMIACGIVNLTAPILKDDKF
nr:uncharacterized protein LOC109428591 [Aedes albopictus]